MTHIPFVIFVPVPSPLSCIACTGSHVCCLYPPVALISFDRSDNDLRAVGPAFPSVQHDNATSQARIPPIRWPPPALAPLRSGAGGDGGALGGGDDDGCRCVAAEPCGPPLSEPSSSPDLCPCSPNSAPFASAELAPACLW